MNCLLSAQRAVNALVGSNNRVKPLLPLLCTAFLTMYENTRTIIRFSLQHFCFYFLLNKNETICRPSPLCTKYQVYGCSSYRARYRLHGTGHLVPAVCMGLYILRSARCLIDDGTRLYRFFLLAPRGAFGRKHSLLNISRGRGHRSGVFPPFLLPIGTKISHRRAPRTHEYELGTINTPTQHPESNARPFPCRRVCLYVPGMIPGAQSHRIV